MSMPFWASRRKHERSWRKCGPATKTICHYSGAPPRSMQFSTSATKHLNCSIDCAMHVLAWSSFLRDIQVSTIYALTQGMESCRSATACRSEGSFWEKRPPRYSYPHRRESGIREASSAPRHPKELARKAPRAVSGRLVWLYQE